MNKTISVNIRGIIFNIEEEAYQLLSAYLESLKAYLGKSAASDEITADIESRIAELFSEKITNQNQVITQTEVEAVITTLGQPEEYLLDEEDLKSGEPEKANEAGAIDIEGSQKVKRRVFRNPDDKIAGGVLSGFGAYFDVDPLWWRLGFVFVFFLGWGSPVFLYLILWIIIPEARTRAEKLQMRGEPITVESLKRTVEEETEHIRKRAAGLTDDSTAEKLRNGVQEIFHFFETAFRWIFKILGKVVGAFFLLGGIGMTIFLIVSWLFTVTSPGTSEQLINDNPFSNFFGLFPSSESDGQLIQYGALLLFVSMSLGMMMVGVRLLFNQLNNFRKYRIGIILLVAGIAGGTMLAIGGGHTALDYSKQEMTSIRKSIPLISDTIRLSVNESNMFTKLSNHRGYDHFSSIRIIDNKIYSKEIRLDIQRVDSLQEVELKIETYAQGRNNLDAMRRVRNIKYEYIADSTGKFVFEPFFQYNTADRYRAQQIDITLYLPVGKSIYLSPGSEDLIYNIKNLSDTWDHDMVGHTWTMTAEGLFCPDFPKEVKRW